MTPANHYLNSEKRKAAMMRKPFDWLQEEQWQGIQVVLLHCQLDISLMYAYHSGCWYARYTSKPSQPTSVYTSCRCTASYVSDELGVGIFFNCSPSCAQYTHGRATPTTEKTGLAMLAIKIQNIPFRLHERFEQLLRLLLLGGLVCQPSTDLCRRIFEIAVLGISETDCFFLS